MTWLFQYNFYRFLRIYIKVTVASDIHNSNCVMLTNPLNNTNYFIAIERNVWKRYPLMPNRVIRSFYYIVKYILV